MSGDGGAALTILLPEASDPAWVDVVRARVGGGAEAMAASLGLAPPSLVVTRQGSEAVLLAGPVRQPLGAAGVPMTLAVAAIETLSINAWQALIAPALAARGVGAQRWLRHAARRGLTVDELAALVRDDAPEELIAWRLADAHPPTFTLMAGRHAMATLADAEFRRAAAMEAATHAGLPIPIPGEPVPDPLLDDDQAVLMIGALRRPILPPAGLGRLLALLAPSLVDPALAVALLTDEARIPRRLGTLALASPGPVAVAEAMLRAMELAPWPIDLQAVVETASGIGTPQ